MSTPSSNNSHERNPFPLAPIPAGPTELADPNPVSSEMRETTTGILAGVTDYLAGDGPFPSTAIIQKEAYSKSEEAERDYFVEQLGTKVGNDIDSRLTTFEKQHRLEYARPEDPTHVWVVVLPWMKQAFGMDDADEIQGCWGVVRRAQVHTDGQPPLVLQEIEFPNRVVGQNGVVRDRMHRVLWFTAE